MSSPPFPYGRPDDARRLPHYSSTIPAVAGDGYFAQQALQAGLYGGVARRPAGEEQARREAEKERIREELLVREAVWRRELEEEVRRELAADREMAFRREHDVMFSADSARHVSREDLFHERLWWPGAAEEGLFQAVPEERRVVEGGGFGRPKPRFLGRRSTAFREKTATGPGFKRVFSPSSPSRSVGFGKSIVPERPRKGWYCDICQVTANSLQVFNDHLGGKKHKAMEEEALEGNLRADPGKRKSREFTNSDADKIDFTARKGFKRPNKQIKNEHFADRSADQFKMKRKKFSFFCEYCEVGCFSEIVMASHYRGKKHNLRMEELRKLNGSTALEESLKEEAAGVVTSEDKRSEESNAGAGF